MRQKTTLTEQDLNVIKDIYENSECYTSKELYRMILDQFESEDLEYELLENGTCIECFEDELERQLEYRNEEGEHYCYQCNACDFIQYNI